MRKGILTLEGTTVKLEDFGDGTFRLEASPFSRKAKFWSMYRRSRLLMTSILNSFPFGPSDGSDKHSPDAWNRIQSFTEAFLPSFSLSLPPLDLHMWQKAVKRFKPRAVRGPCGWSKDDLLNLSPARALELLQLLTKVEHGELDWPSPLLVGFVCSLSKGNGRTDVQGFRPIVLYPILYRCCASLRSRQVLRALKAHLPPDRFCSWQRAG